MPVVHIYIPEGWVSQERMKIMAEEVTDAVVAAEGVPFTRDMTYVLIHEVADGGWSFKRKVHTIDSIIKFIPPDTGGGKPATIEKLFSTVKNSIEEK